MNSQNQLASWLKFFDQNVGSGPTGANVYNGFTPDPNHGQNRLLWALDQARNDQRQAQMQHPDFFGGGGGGGQAPDAPAYVRPRSIDMGAQRPREEFNDPMRGKIVNYLAQLLGK